MKHLLLLIVVLLVAVSCGKIPDNQVIPSYATASASQITSMLKTNFSMCDPMFIFSDETYVLPTTKWVKGTFTDTLAKFLFDYNVTQYKVDSNDCDDFALYGRAVANALNRHNPEGKKHGIAVGTFSRLIDFGIGRHALNFIVVADEDKQPKILFYEPQIQQVISTDTNITVFWWTM